MIARRELQDPLFQKAVVLMLPLVDKDDVVGLIVNKPTRISLHVLFPKNSAFKGRTDVAYFGGPVDVKTAGVLFRSTKAFKPAFHLSGDLYVSFDPDLIDKIMKRPKQVSDARLFLGRSQWWPDQLAREMELGSWFGEKEETSVIFRPDSANVWLELIGELDPGNVAQLRDFYSDEVSGM
ncbi:MAG TPA: YqgE/AlgH family protein [Candidatus Acidoferrales bacterium]|nr:YqgE/AlgH family protein [Candidatus Acidoferrales bacterium]